MAKYDNFKSYIKEKYSDYLKQVLFHFVDKNHVGQGFHSINVLSLCKQDVDNLEIKSPKCHDLPGPFVKIDVNLTADIITLGLGTKYMKPKEKPGGLKSI